MTVQWQVSGKGRWEELPQLSSRQNPRVRAAFAIRDEHQAKKQGKIFLEGLRQIRTALPALLDVDFYFADDARGASCYREILQETEESLTAVRQNAKTTVLSAVPVGSASFRAARLASGLFDQLAETRHSQGIIAMAEAPRLLSLTELPAPAGADGKPGTEEGRGMELVLLEHPQDPGNLGTIIRTVEAFGYAALVLVGESVWPFSAKVLRASMGSAFYLPIYQVADIESFRAAFPRLPLYALDMHGRDLRSLSRRESSEGLALLFGNEGNGLSPAARQAASATISIPMQGRAESLNLAAAVAIASWYCKFPGKAWKD